MGRRGHCGSAWEGKGSEVALGTILGNMGLHEDAGHCGAMRRRGAWRAEVRCMGQSAESGVGGKRGGGMEASDVTGVQWEAPDAVGAHAEVRGGTEVLTAEYSRVQCHASGEAEGAVGHCEHRGDPCIARALCATFRLDSPVKKPRTKPFQTPSKLGHRGYPSSGRLRTTLPSHQRP